MLTTIKIQVSATRLLQHISIGLVLLAFCLTPLTASAHKEVKVGSYVFEIGWTNEPVLVSERNGLYLFITSANESDHAEETSDHNQAEEASEHDHAEETSQNSQTAGVTGAETTLEFAVEYGGVRKTYPLRPVLGSPGQYTIDLIPTREGQYTFIFSGSINGEAIELEFEPEEVEPMDDLAFPEAPLSGAQLTAQLAAVQAQANTSQMIAIGGVILGLIGAGLGVYGLVKK